MSITMEEFAAAMAKERRAEHAAAQAFAAACERGDAEAMYTAVDAMDETIDGWRLAMKRVGRFQAVSDDIRSAFLPVWTEHKTLGLKVRDRRALANALHVLFPPAAAAEPLTLYRGATSEAAPEDVWVLMDTQSGHRSSFCRGNATRQRRQCHSDDRRS